MHVIRNGPDWAYPLHFTLSQLLQIDGGPNWWDDWMESVSFCFWALSFEMIKLQPLILIVLSPGPHKLVFSKVLTTDIVLLNAHSHYFWLRTIIMFSAWLTTTWWVSQRRKLLAVKVPIKCLLGQIDPFLIRNSYGQNSNTWGTMVVSSAIYCVLRQFLMHNCWTIMYLLNFPHGF